MRKVIIPLSILFALAAAISAQQIMIFEFKATGVDEATEFAVRELFKSELADHGYSTMEAPEGQICNDAACAVGFMKGTMADQALFGSITKLGQKLIVNINVVNTEAQIIHTDKLSAASVEDLDTVIERLARGIAEGKKAGEVIDKTTVTEEEAEEPTRRKNFYTVGARIGYRYPIGKSYGEDEMWQYEAVAMYELENMFVEGRGYGCSGGDVFAYGLTVGLNYLFSKKDFAPYAGGAAGIEWASNVPYTESETGDTVRVGFASGNGPTFNLGGGLMAFQTYDFRLILDVRYSITFLGEADIDWTFDDQEVDLGTEHSISFTLGITKRDITGERSGSTCCMPW